MSCDCARERDVLDAITIGCWPDRVDAELRAHVTRCAICADVVEIAPVLFAERDAAWEEADVPSATAVWWRARLRARREAAEQAARPMVLVQRAALVYAAAAVFGFGVLIGPWIRVWLRTALGVVQWLAPTDDTVAIASRVAASHPPLLGVTLGILILAPLFLYLARADR